MAVFTLLLKMWRTDSDIEAHKYHSPLLQCVTWYHLLPPMQYFRYPFPSHHAKAKRIVGQGCLPASPSLSIHRYCWCRCLYFLFFFTTPYHTCRCSVRDVSPDFVSGKKLFCISVYSICFKQAVINFFFDHGTWLCVSIFASVRLLY